MPKQKSKQQAEVVIDFSRLARQEILVPIAVILGSLLVSCTIFLGSRNLLNSTPAVQVQCDPADSLSADCLIKYAQDTNLDLDKFQECVDNKSFDTDIAAELEAGNSFGVSGTPTVFIGKGSGDNFKGFLLGGVLTADQLKEGYDLVNNNSIEKAQGIWINKQLDLLNGLRSQVVDYYKSSEGGSLKGKALNTKVDQVMAEQRQLIESIYGLKDLSTGKGMVKGTGETVIMEFSDYECPYCKDFAAGALKQFNAEYVDTGKARVVFRDYPIESIHPDARPAANAARCAGDQGKYFEYHDKLFGIN